MGLRLEATPTRDLPAKNWKKCSQLIKCYHFRWSLQKNTKRDCFKQHPCLSNQMSRALMSNSFGSLHICKKLGKSRVLAQNRVFRGKTRFYLPLPDKTEVYSPTREISRVWRYRVDIDLDIDGQYGFMNIYEYYCNNEDTLYIIRTTHPAIDSYERGLIVGTHPLCCSAPNNDPEQNLHSTKFKVLSPWSAHGRAMVILPWDFPVIHPMKGDP